MTWADYERAIRGYELRQVREWERIRQAAEWSASFLGVDLKKQLAKHGRKRLIDLPTDSGKAAKVETDEDFLARMAANNYFRKNRERK